MQTLLTLLSGAMLLGAGDTGMACAQVGVTDPGFRDVPRGRRAYQLGEALEKIWPPVRFRNSNRSGSPILTRYEFAVRTAILLDKLPNAEDSPLPPAAVSALRSLTDEFASEMKRLGVSISDVQVRLANSFPFPNVSKSHWAASSIERLRKSGIVIGMPSGEF